MRAWPLLDKLPDGSAKVYLDSGGKGFIEPELRYPDPLDPPAPERLTLKKLQVEVMDENADGSMMDENAGKATGELGAAGTTCQLGAAGITCHRRVRRCRNHLSKGKSRYLSKVTSVIIVFQVCH